MYEIEFISSETSLLEKRLVNTRLCRQIFTCWSRNRNQGINRSLDMKAISVSGKENRVQAHQRAVILGPEGWQECASYRGRSEGLEMEGMCPQHGEKCNKDSAGPRSAHNLSCMSGIFLHFSSSLCSLFSSKPSTHQQVKWKGPYWKVRIWEVWVCTCTHSGWSVRSVFLNFIK